MEETDIQPIHERNRQVTKMEKITAFVITVATIMLLFPLCYEWGREVMELPIWEKAADALEKTKDLFNRLIGNSDK